MFATAAVLTLVLVVIAVTPANDSNTQWQCGTSLWWLCGRHRTGNGIAGVAQNLAVAAPLQLCRQYCC
jgi:hypothetical protein